MKYTVDLTDIELAEFVRVRKHSVLAELVAKDKPQGQVIVNLRMTASMLQKFIDSVHEKAANERMEASGSKRVDLKEPKKVYCRGCNREVVVVAVIGNEYNVERLKNGVEKYHPKADCDDRE